MAKLKTFCYMNKEGTETQTVIIPTHTGRSKEVDHEDESRIVTAII